MRLTVQLKAINNQLILPLNYQEALQGLLYHSMNDSAFTAFLHNEGFQKGKRTFKLFTFSRLFGKHVIDRKLKTITYTDTVTWHIGSVLPEVVQKLGTFLLLNSGDLELNHQAIQIEGIDVDDLVIDKHSYVIEMLSPITVYSTFEQKDGRKKTNFFSPSDEVFPIMVENNFYNKYEAYFGKKPCDPFELVPLDIKPQYKVVTSYKGFLLTAWQGRFQLTSSPEQIRFAYGAGLGSKNSQGFGMFRMLKAVE